MTNGGPTDYQFIANEGGRGGGERGCGRDHNIITEPCWKYQIDFNVTQPNSSNQRLGTSSPLIFRDLRTFWGWMRVANSYQQEKKRNSSPFDAFLQPYVDRTTTQYHLVHSLSDYTTCILKDSPCDQRTCLCPLTIYTIYYCAKKSNKKQNPLLSSPVMTAMGSLAGPGPIFVEADTVML